MASQLFSLKGLSLLAWLSVNSFASTILHVVLWRGILTREISSHNITVKRDLQWSAAGLSPLFSSLQFSDRFCTFLLSLFCFKLPTTPIVRTLSYLNLVLYISNWTMSSPNRKKKVSGLTIVAWWSFCHLMSNFLCINCRQIPAIFFFMLLILTC